MPLQTWSDKLRHLPSLSMPGDHPLLTLSNITVNAFSGFGANGLSVVNSIDGEQHDSAAEAETPAVIDFLPLGS